MRDWHATPRAEQSARNEIPALSWIAHLNRASSPNDGDLRSPAVPEEVRRPAKGGRRAYEARLGKDRSPRESRHSIARAK